MFRLIAVSLIVGSVCAFWGADSDNYGDFSMNSYRDSDSNNLYDNDDRYSGLGNRFYDDDDDDDDDSYRNRFFMAGFGRRQRWQQPRRQQSITRFNPANRRSSRSQRQTSWGSFQRQPQRPVPTQSRQPSRNRFQSQRGLFGGNSLAQAALMYNAFDGFDMDFF